MLNENDFLNVIKKASLDAVNASKPCDYCFGKVTSVSPLKISIEQKLTLGSAQLILTRNVTNFQTTMTINAEQRQVTIHNGLKVGDEVILLKQKGGQKYLVIDRVVKA